MCLYELRISMDATKYYLFPDNVELHFPLMIVVASNWSIAFITFKSHVISKLSTYLLYVVDRAD
jgi:hypothetical protein